MKPDTAQLLMLMRVLVSLLLMFDVDSRYQNRDGSMVGVDRREDKGLSTGLLSMEIIAQLAPDEQLWL